MDSDERIFAHVVSVWRESKNFFSIGGREGMLLLTDRHLMFVHKTEAKMKWWKAVIPRQFLIFMKSKNTLITHDGYNEKDLIIDLDNEKNLEVSFDDISKIDYEEKTWGSVLNLEFSKNGKNEKYQFSVAKDWVKYPAKDPMTFLKVDWAPFVQHIKERKKITE